MGRLTVTPFTSRDGGMQAPGGPNEDVDAGFAFGGWLVPHMDEAGGEAVVRVHLAAAGFVLGRRSYDILGSYWPNVTDADDPIAAKPASTSSFGPPGACITPSSDVNVVTVSLPIVVLLRRAPPPSAEPVSHTRRTGDR